MKSSNILLTARLLLNVLAVGVCLHLGVSAARADAPARVFVASTGDDANVGSPASPKRNFQAAHDAVVTGGEIVTLDTAGYGLLTITKSVTITVPPGVNGFIAAATQTAGVTINAPAGSLVTLRGLVIQGAKPSNAAGVAVNSAGTLRMEDCTISGGLGGIYTSTTTATHLVMQGCRLRDLANGVYAEAMTFGAPVDVIATDCKMDRISNAALLAYTQASGGSVRLYAIRCVLTECGQGVFAFGGSAVTAYVDNCTLSTNTTGVTTSNSGSVITRSNNTFTHNQSDGAFTGTLAAK